MEQSLRADVEASLRSLREGQKISRPSMIHLLTRVLVENPGESIFPEPEDESDPEVRKRRIRHAREQATRTFPQRNYVSNWNLGKCKRCLKNEVRDGDVVVKIPGFGWYHDECYKIMNPEFYRGL